MLDPTVHASIISVAGEWAKFVYEIDKPRTKLSKSKSISLLRRNFETAYKEILMAIQIYEPREKK